MEIKLPLQTSLSSSPSSNARSDGLSLQLNQRVEAKVLETQIAQNRILLAIADKTITVQSQEPIDAFKGQQLELQVSRLLPYPVFALQPKTSLTDSQSQALNSVSLPLLTVIQPSNTPPPESTAFRMDKLVQNQVLIATVVQVETGKLTLQLNSTLSPTSHSATLIAQNPIISLEATQLVFDPEFTPKQQSSLLSTASASGHVNTHSTFNAGKAIIAGLTNALPSTSTRTLGQIQLGQLTPKADMFIGLKAINSESAYPTIYEVWVEEAPDSANKPGQLSTQQKTFDLAKVIDIKSDKVLLEIISDPNSDVSTSKRATLQLDLKQLIPSALLSKALPSGTQANTLPTTTEALNLKPGLEIRLEVIETGTIPRFSCGLSPGDEQEAIIEAQKRLLPLQASSQSLLGLLKHWQQNGIADHEVADTLHRLANAILHNLPDNARLSEPSQLKQAIANSGVFMESTLAELLKGQGDRPSPEDFKVKLSQFLDDLKQQLNQAHTKQSSTELLEALREGIKKTESLLARITLNQLNSLPQDDTSKQTWIIELPFVDQQQFQQLDMAIQQDREVRAPQTAKGWGVSITLTPPDLGTIHCKISCYEGSINTRFWSESAATVDKIATHLDYLQQQLESKGLMTGHMEAYQGKPSTNETSSKKQTQLLNVKA